uniref:Uncharacterized protein n=1 Tax=Romanomermis culicivorax TaxID=13658 RepID=A0A915K1J1_ROMCU
MQITFERPRQIWMAMEHHEKKKNGDENYSCFVLYFDYMPTPQILSIDKGGGLNAQAIACSPQALEPTWGFIPDQERFRLQERAPVTSTQELAMQLSKLKGTMEALLDIIANAATEDNKREADSRQQEPDRQ